jgi:hypothetical protein
MTQLPSTVVHRNPLSAIQAQFLVRRLPQVEFSVQKITIPGLFLPSVIQNTPDVNIKHAGDQLAFGDLRVEFLVDEYMDNYLSIYQWLIWLGFPNGNEHRNLTSPLAKASGEGVWSDATILILDNKQNPRLECTVKQMFPTTLSDIVLDVTADKMQYVKATATFAYTEYSMRRPDQPYEIGEYPVE